MLFLSRLVQRGTSQTSQGGLARWVYYPSGEFDGGFGLPSSRLAYKHPQTFNGLKEPLIPWTRDARYL